MMLISSLRVKAIYDDNFKEKFGADVVNTARRVLAQAQSLYKLRDSLTTEINFKVDPEVDYVPGRWVASTDLLVFFLKKGPNPASFFFIFVFSTHS